MSISLILTTFSLSISAGHDTGRTVDCRVVDSIVRARISLPTSAESREMKMAGVWKCIKPYWLEGTYDKVIRLMDSMAVTDSSAEFQNYYCAVLLLTGDFAKADGYFRKFCARETWDSLMNLKFYDPKYSALYDRNRRARLAEYRAWPDSTEALINLAIAELLYDKNLSGYYHLHKAHHLDPDHVLLKNSGSLLRRWDEGRVGSFLLSYGTSEVTSFNPDFTYFRELGVEGSLGRVFLRPFFRANFSWTGMKAPVSIYREDGSYMPVDHFFSWGGDFGGRCRVFEKNTFSVELIGGMGGSFATFINADTVNHVHSVKETTGDFTAGMALNRCFGKMDHGLLGIELLYRYINSNTDDRAPVLDRQQLYLRVVIGFTGRTPAVFVPEK